ncbi:hypothetical protein EXIGLDRAFT_730316 [Exidia glandulosa HHB12029]|uniref:Uncharacterized protein n=1 Tax=Exidia glandulosa HHB12029 TaxID=1314781 RepID=A0A165C8E6_EXIGL|nr:hypothetical protein EXIGLDRAFT_730316 [Exidia glandulosa HHB12029]
MSSHVMFEPLVRQSLGLFGGSVAPQYQHPALSRAQHQSEERSPPYNHCVTPETYATRYEHARAWLPAHDEEWGQDAPDNAPTVVENKVGGIRTDREW